MGEFWNPNQYVTIIKQIAIDDTNYTALINHFSQNLSL